MPGQTASPLVLVPGSGQDAVSELRRFIRAHATVTAALQRWCELTGLAEGPIEAKALAASATAEPPDAISYALRLPFGPDKPTGGADVVRRRVALTCGAHVLVEAVNWYVPSRLPPDAVAALEQSAIPFSQVLEPLGIVRLDVRDLPAGPNALFAQRAIVAQKSGVRLAYVEENFQSILLARHVA